MFGYNWRMNYRGQSLSQLIADYGGEEVSAIDVYSDIFQLGYGFIQHTGEGYTHKANPIILGNFNGKMQRQVMLEDTFEDQLAIFQQADWAILNGLTYWGRRNRADAQSQLCAYMIDLDGISPKTFNNFLHAAYESIEIYDDRGVYPIPQYVIMSGTNVHLYYVLEAPISLYPKAKTELKKLKYALTDLIWNRYTSFIKHPQHQGINQGFRIIGGKTKKGGVVRAFRLNLHPTSIEELNQYVKKENRADVQEIINPVKHYTREEAKELFPEWYERVVEGKGERKLWTVKEDLYNWWLRKLNEEGNVTYGHRYFCIMALAIYASKCGIIDKDRVKADAIKLQPLFNSLKPDAPFTEGDIDSALECLDQRYCTFPRKDIEKITAIQMPANKRNGLKQAQHLEIARAIRDVKQKQAGRCWTDGNSRKGCPNKKHPKRDLILSYAKEHPQANHSEIARALGISRPTVIKWLKNQD